MVKIRPVVIVWLLAVIVRLPLVRVSPVPDMVPFDQVVDPLTVSKSDPVSVPLERVSVPVLMGPVVLRFSVPPETVIVEGYPDRMGDGSAGAQGLAERRASAVKRAMTAAGIPADRVSAVVGDRPASPGTAAGSFEVTVPSTKRSP